MNDASAGAGPPPVAPPRGRRRPGARLRSAGRLSWAALGIVGVLIVVGVVLRQLSFVVIPLILALFPATLLVPVANWLQRWLPAVAAALATLVAGIVIFAGAIVGTVSLLVSGLPGVAESAGEGLGELQVILQRFFPNLEISGVEDLLSMVGERISDTGDVASQAMSVTIGAFETLAGVLLMVVVLFFYLREGRGLVEGLAGMLPDPQGDRAIAAAEDAWDTLGKYFRGQLLVALTDAVLIGLGLVLLDIPLALPLAALVFFGGLFPIVGAVVTGALAVLVAFSDGGLTLGLIVAGIVLVVQQVESNVTEPIILGHAIDLHPLVVVLSIAAGGILLGVLGAFLAVPAAAILKRVVKDHMGRRRAEA